MDLDRSPGQYTPLPLGDSLFGALLGSAVGDALGLPYEGLSPGRALRLFGPPDRHRFLFGRGMISDDTEHLCMTAQALCASPTTASLFARRLSLELRWWLLGAPAGIGLATLRSILKLWLGWSPEKSGVFSAGNGPAMRSTLIGASLDSLDEIRSFVFASTRITHSDPKAFLGALAVAIAAWCSRRDQNQFETFLDDYRLALNEPIPPDWEIRLMQVKEALDKGISTEQFAQAIGLQRGVSGFMYHTVPVVLHAWLAHGNCFESAIQGTIRCGGDTDSTAAILGAILGAGCGPAGIPNQLRKTILEWPRTTCWMESLSLATETAIQTGRPGKAPVIRWVFVLPRNALFFMAVLFHGARRLMPPY